MVHVTDKAKQELKKLLTAKVDWPGARLRLIDRGQGVLGLGIDLASPGDEVVEYNGEVILVFEPDITTSFQLVTLDVDETPDGPELVIIEDVVEKPSGVGRGKGVPAVTAS